MCTLLAGTSPWCTALSYPTAKSLAVSRPGEKCQICLSSGQTLILYWDSFVHEHLYSQPLLYLSILSSIPQFLTEVMNGEDH